MPRLQQSKRRGADQASRVDQEARASIRPFGMDSVVPTSNLGFGFALQKMQCADCQTHKCAGVIGAEQWRISTVLCDIVRLNHLQDERGARRYVLHCTQERERFIPRRLC